MTRSVESPLEAAVRALRRREHTAWSLGAYLERRGVGAEEREAAIARVCELGYLDDARFAAQRAGSLAARGCGDAAIAADLERHGVARGLAEAAITALEPERERAVRVVARRGSGPGTRRYLAARGFSEDVFDSDVADTAEGAVG